MQVAVLHNLVAADAPPDHLDVLVQAEAVCQALGRLGHQTVTHGCGLDLEALRAWLWQRRPDLVFNLVESLADADRLAVVATALLDVLEVPYTGNPTEATFLTNYKLLAKERLNRAGLPTPGWITADPVPAGQVAGTVSPSPLRPDAPYIIKPIAEHASFGLDEQSVVTCSSREMLVERIREQTRRLGRTCFAEEFIDGREFNVSVLAAPEGACVLPPAEIDFSAFPEGKTRIVDYRAKWEEGTFEYDNTPRHFDFRPHDKPLLDELTRLAHACWGLFRLAGYVRVDFWVDPAGRPWILEINTNPCLSPDGGFAAAVAQAGMSYEQAIARIVDDAVRRLRPAGMTSRP